MAKNRKTIKQIAKEGLTEEIWRKFEHRICRKERYRLIRQRRIIPANRMRPQLMIKDSTGRWCPQLDIRRIS